ncbi:Starch-binding associating with outer membrane [compost metagenome]
MNPTPTLNLITGDEYLIIDNGLEKLSKDLERDAYLWKTDRFKIESGLAEWYRPYQQIFYANIVLEGLENNKEGSSKPAEYNNVKGAALFYRALAFYNLIQIFCPVYEEKNASNTEGIALRLSADVNLQPKKSSLQESYEQIITDLKLAQQLLPEKALTKNRPGSHAATALLARVFLAMSNYADAEKWASAALQIDKRLIDYNTIPQGVSAPFPDPLPNNNDELIYSVLKIGYTFGGVGVLRVDNELLNSFDEKDLRPKIFFYKPASGAVNNKNYDGLANDEMYLIQAECLIRRGQFAPAAALMNTLGVNRFQKGSYIPITFTNENDALNHIILERRKELFGRETLRWTDLKRFNKDPRFAKTLHRTYNGVAYQLNPQSPLYVYPSPIGQ